MNPNPKPKAKSQSPKPSAKTQNPTPYTKTLDQTLDPKPNILNRKP